MVLEEIPVELLDDGLAGREYLRRQAEVRVAGVLGRQREQDPTEAAVRELPGKHVEQHEEAVLATRCQRDVVGVDRPAVFPAQKFGQRLAETDLTSRFGVIADESRQAIGPVDQFDQPLADNRLEFRNTRRVAATQHRDTRRVRQRRAEIIHQFPGARRAREALAESRVVHVRRSSRHRRVLKGA